MSSIIKRAIIIALVTLSTLIISMLISNRVLQFISGILLVLILAFYLANFNPIKMLEILGIKKEGLARGLIIAGVFLFLTALIGIFLFGVGVFSIDEEFMPGYSSAMIILFAMIFAFAEEIAFRGLVMSAIIGEKPTTIKFIYASILSSILFAFWHLQFDIRILMHFSVAILWCVLYHASKRNIIASTAVHGISNVWMPVNSVFSMIIGLLFGL